MTGTMHPRLQARLLRIEQIRAVAADQDLLQTLRDVESLAARVDEAVGSRLSAAVHESCARFRAALADHPATSRAGRTVRRHLPDRIRELTADCEATAAALPPIDRQGTAAGEPRSAPLVAAPPGRPAANRRHLRLVDPAAP